MSDDHGSTPAAATWGPAPAPPAPGGNPAPPGLAPGPGGPARALDPLTPVPRISDALLGFVAGMGGMLLGLGLGMLPALLLDVEELVVLGVVLSGVLGLGGLWLVLGLRAGWGLADLGFRRSRSHHAHLLWQLPVLFVANLVVTLLVAAATGLLDSGAQSDVSSEDPLLGLGGGVRWWLVVPGVLMIGVLLPLVEEIVFRRLLLDWLGSWLPMWVSGLIVIVLFGVVHVVPPAIVYVGGLGVGLVLLRWWHGTLWAPLALHVANNLLVASLAVGAALA